MKRYLQSQQRCKTMLILVFLSFALGQVSSFADWMATDYCNRRLVPGEIIMNQRAELSKDRVLRVFRGNKELFSGSQYYANEELVVTISDNSDQYLFEASNADFVDGGCDNSRIANNNEAVLTLRSAGDVQLVGAWASSHDIVYISEPFVLAEGHLTAKAGQVRKDLLNSFNGIGQPEEKQEESEELKEANEQFMSTSSQARRRQREQQEKDDLLRREQKLANKELRNANKWLKAGVKAVTGAANTAADQLGLKSQRASDPYEANERTVESKNMLDRILSRSGNKEGRSSESDFEELQREQLPRGGGGGNLRKGKNHRDGHVKSREDAPAFESRDRRDRKVKESSGDTLGGRVDKKNQKAAEQQDDGKPHRKGKVDKYERKQEKRSRRRWERNAKDDTALSGERGGDAAVRGNKGNRRRNNANRGDNNYGGPSSSSGAFGMSALLPRAGPYRVVYTMIILFVLLVVSIGALVACSLFCAQNKFRVSKIVDKFRGDERGNQ